MRSMLISTCVRVPLFVSARRIVMESSDAEGSQSQFFCPCWSPMNDASTCCNRTDDGTGLQFGDADNDPVCVPSGQGAHQDCERYCNLRCGSVPHPNDADTLMEYVTSKVMEVPSMGVADVMMAYLVMKVNTLWESQTVVNIPVAHIHQMHPVGSWRPRTWETTQQRANAVIAGADLIAANGMNITQELTYSQEVLTPLQSVGLAAAVPFGYCGWSHFFQEGNGRLKGIRLAQEQHPGILGEDLRMEATLFTYTPNRLKSIHHSIARLWAQYVTEMYDADPSTEQGMIDGYMGFRIGLVRCNGMHGFDGCPVVSTPGELPSTLGHHDMVAATEIVGVEEARILRNPQLIQFESVHTEEAALKYYKLCSGGYMVGDADGITVTEYCPRCIDLV